MAEQHEGRKPIKDIGTADNANIVEVDAFVTALGGLSSAGIVHALAAMGKDSAWFAGEIVAMYTNTEEKYYKSKCLHMMADLMKQKEGQRVVVEPLSSATTTELHALEAKVAASVSELLEGPDGRQSASEVLVGGDDQKSLPSSEHQQSEASEDGDSEEKCGDAVSVRPTPEAGEVSSE